MRSREPGPVFPQMPTKASFELSFDGKAMDRSDIFRMVDSFSIAISDEDEEDEEEDSFQQRSANNRILPAEILSNEPLK